MFYDAFPIHVGNVNNSIIIEIDLGENCGVNISKNSPGLFNIGSEFYIRSSFMIRLLAVWLPNTKFTTK